MSHLTEEQFEEILPEDARIPDHVRQCAECRARLARKRRLARRVRDAFASVQATPALADRIRVSIGSSEARTGPAQSRAQTVILHVHRHLWSGLAAAAAILILGVPATLYLGTTSEAQAARMELVAIHEQNLQSMKDLFVHEDPNALANYLGDKTGHTPAMPCPKSGLEMCGCCVRQFRGRSAGSYMVRTEAGLVSVIVASDAPRSLGLVPAEKTDESKPLLWQGACEACRIASIRIDGRSYYAIGQVPPAELESVLHSLLD